MRANPIELWAAEVCDLHVVIKDLREAAEIFRELGDFSCYVHRKDVLEQLKKAHAILKHHDHQR